jgi:hypothetical protein
VSAWVDRPYGGGGDDSADCSLLFLMWTARTTDLLMVPADLLPHEPRRGCSGLSVTIAFLPLSPVRPGSSPRSTRRSPCRSSTCRT